MSLNLLIERPMTVTSRRSLFFCPFLYTYLLCVSICPSKDGLFCFQKNFLRNLKFGVSFLARFSAVGKCRVQILRRTLTIEYTFIRYVAWAMGETLSCTKVRQDPPAAYGISGTQGGERPRNRFRNIRLLRIRR